MNLYGIRWFHKLLCPLAVYLVIIDFASLICIPGTSPGGFAIN